MGYTFVKGILRNPKRTVTKEVRFLVDTGAGYLALPNSLAKELELRTAMHRLQ